MIKRLILLVLAATVIGLLITGVAMAFTTADIVKDFEDGELNGTYSRSQFNAFLNSPYDAVYPTKNDRELRLLVKSMLTDRSTFPFTGFQLMIAGIVAVVLVGGGLVLRRFARSS